MPNPAPIRFIMLGGFLGAGKTTTIARLAEHFQRQGKTVAVVTNDKAADSVDTLRLQAQGLNVGEMPGACFCGNVDELIGMVDALGAAARPDVVLAEPVGSCLDMVGTVIRPLEASYGRRFEVAPFGVLVKPYHAGKILRGEENAGVSPQAAYIFRQQLAEADFAAINRADQLSDAQIAELERLLTAAHPETPVVSISAKTGRGFEAFIALVERRGEFGKRSPVIDYDQYAAGEAELGWLNATLLVAAEAPVEVDRLLVEFLRGFRDAIRGAGGEVAHLKAIVLGGGRHAAAGVVGNAVEPELSHAAGASVDRFQWVVNARAACEPATLERLAKAEWTSAAARHGATVEVAHLQCFSPGRPAVPSVID
jgi:Ni2+-binding GTPase involved in maturation of urease and hydrogenase